ncbi:MAG: cytochrome c oxidase accessory protein CcoG [Bdellovibrionaceae bacterium]|nr:cytochrome c oxidase accessory protein CcoG [Pseudobdellovibrionaceae bacterium]MBX3034033.1 cytochrome c oxidase accessory protein CcoG [Pseudobdellovibrionaceae bacterium]
MSTDFRDRPSMLDQYGGRLPLFPAEVRGVWRSRRTVVQVVLMLVFLLLPWIHINGAPAVLMDLGQHRFAFFGLKLWAHDSPLLFPVLGIFALGLALVTALYGRIWCGWACPQTVFLDGVIRRIERWTEGTHLQRRALAAAPWSFDKARRKVLKWALFVLFTILLTHTFLAYFFGTDGVLSMLARDPRENWGAFVFILFANGLMLFDLAWFREQFCMIVCPYGRIQSVLMDRQTVVVQYDSARGEPRKAKGVAAPGACVSCNRCVNVCPTGIDIRNGLQLECISCTACIDACDDVMEKTKQPKGLIRHFALNPGPSIWRRPRILLYLIALLLLAGSLIFALSSHSTLSVTVLRALDTPYFERQNENGEAIIVNSYRLHAHNQTDAALRMQVSLESTPEATLRVPESMLELKQDQSRMIPFTVEVPKTSLQGRGGLPLKIRVQEQTYEVEFVAPHF